MDYYGYRQSHGQNNSITPSHDSDKNNAIFTNSTYNKYGNFKQDSINDLLRWVNKFDSTVNEYADQKYAYEKEKELKIENRKDRKKMKLMVSDNKGFLEDMRKGFDWFYNTFDFYPRKFKQFKKEYSIELKRLKKLKKYLSYRVRSLAGKGMYNEPSKDILQFIRIKIDAINILFNPKYNERTPIEDIYGLDKFEDDETDSLDGLNRNQIFSYD